MNERTFGVAILVGLALFGIPACAILNEEFRNITVFLEKMEKLARPHGDILEDLRSFAIRGKEFTESAASVFQFLKNFDLERKDGQRDRQDSIFISEALSHLETEFNAQGKKLAATRHAIINEAIVRSYKFLDANIISSLDRFDGVLWWDDIYTSGSTIESRLWDFELSCRNFNQTLEWAFVALKNNCRTDVDTVAAEAVQFAKFEEGFRKVEQTAGLEITDKTAADVYVAIKRGRFVLFKFPASLYTHMMHSLCNYQMNTEYEYDMAPIIAHVVRYLTTKMKQAYPVVAESCVKEVIHDQQRKQRFVGDLATNRFGSTAQLAKAELDRLLSDGYEYQVVVYSANDFSMQSANFGKNYLHITQYRGVNAIATRNNDDWGNRSTLAAKWFDANRWALEAGLRDNYDTFLVKSLPRLLADRLGGPLTSEELYATLVVVRNEKVFESECVIPSSGAYFNRQTHAELNVLITKNVGPTYRIKCFFLL